MARVSKWSATALTGRFFAFEDFDGDARFVGEQRAAPPAGAERADGRQRQQRGVQRDDGAVGRKVVGRGACGGRDQHAVADDFGHTHGAVDGDAKLGGLGGFAEHRDFVDGEGLVGFARTVVGDHR